MAFVITTGCCNDASCVEVCPVDCIRPRPEDPSFLSAEQLHIDPSTCIDCAACMFACPVAAVQDGNDLPAGLELFAAVNAGYFVDHPLVPRPLTAEEPVRPSVRARVAVVGSGPSGCYAAAELIAVPGVEVTLFERLPAPFGLVRSGVAPDHPETRLVGDYFQRVLESPGMTCYLNVDVGVHVTLDEIRASHHAVVLAGGAQGDKALGIPGEGLRGVHAAREVVAWYNGHPEFREATFDLGGPTAVVVGNGNVALDVARVLTRPPESLATTDIADHALTALRGSDLREVVVVARRGPEDAACTFPELWELTHTPGIRVRTLSRDLVGRPARPSTGRSLRTMETFRDLVDDEPLAPGDPPTITFRFGLEPVELVGRSAVEALHLRPTGSLAGPPEVVGTGLVVRAIGYEVVPVPGVPFEATVGTLRHEGGRLVQEGDGGTVPGLYCVGWAKRGPSGVIGSNKVCAQDTVGALLGDLHEGRLAEPSMTADALDRLVRTRRPQVLGLAGVS